MADKPTNNPPTQLDVEKGDLDRAIDAVRALQGGKATVAYVRTHLAKVSLGDLEIVSLGTRVPVSQLMKLR